MRPASGRVSAVPGSLGALPIAACGAAFLLPVSAGEAFWIGLSPADDATTQLLITAEWRDGTSLQLAPIQLPSLRRVAGLPVGQEEFTAFDAALAALLLCCQTVARVEVVDPATFVARTGLDAPEPPNPATGYGGWRLP